MVLAEKISREYPDIPILGLSVASDPEVREWFNEYGSGYVGKSGITPTFLQKEVERILSGSRTHAQPKSFIVHGHDNEALHALKDYIQNTLRLGPPVVLREQPSLGRTIIEKFEEESEDVDLVFVLLAPDDRVVSTATPTGEVRRTRQNVIFELGFFFAKLQRRQGRVILLHKGSLEIPSDISGVVYIDISNGVEAAGESIRRELANWL